MSEENEDRRLRRGLTSSYFRFFFLHASQNKGEHLPVKKNPLSLHPTFQLHSTVHLYGQYLNTHYLHCNHILGFANVWTGNVFKKLSLTLTLTPKLYSYSFFVFFFFFFDSLHRTGQICAVKLLGQAIHVKKMIHISMSFQKSKRECFLEPCNYGYHNRGQSATVIA